LFISTKPGHSGGSTEHMKKSNELLEQQHNLSQQVCERNTSDDSAVIVDQLCSCDLEQHLIKEKLISDVETMRSAGEKVTYLESQLVLTKSDYTMLEEK
jgi:hypothetical protein